MFPYSDFLSPLHLLFFLFSISLAAPYSSYSSLQCPTIPTITLPTPTYGTTGAIFTVCGSQVIHAPLSAVYNAIIDFQKYPQWNSFTVNVALPANVTHTPQDVYVTMPMVLTTQHLLPGQNTTSNERVTFLSPPSEAAQNGVVWAVWRNDDPTGLVQAEHPSILRDAGGGWTSYVSYETYYNGAALVLPLQASLQKEFVEQGVDLKEFVEAGGQ